MLEEGSSNSDDSNPDFTGLMKRVEVHQEIEDSEDDYSSSPQPVKDKAKRQNYSKKISSILKN